MGQPNPFLVCQVGGITLCGRNLEEGEVKEESHHKAHSMTNLRDAEVSYEADMTK